MTVGEKIRKLRKERGLTQKQLGDLCDINEVQIRRYELGGKNSNPKKETLQKIARALDVSISDLYDFPDYKQSLIDDSPFLSALQRAGRDFDSDDMAQELLFDKLIKNLDITEDKQKLLYDYNKLNETGKKEAQKRVAELTEVPRYVEESIEYATRTIANAVQDGHIQFINKPKNEE